MLPYLNSGIQILCVRRCNGLVDIYNRRSVRLVCRQFCEVMMEGMAGVVWYVCMFVCVS